MKTLWKILRSILVVIGFAVLALALFGAWSLRGHDEALPKDIVLTYTFHGTPPDAVQAPAWMSYVMPQEPTLAEVTDALYRAAKDKRVGAFAARLAGGDYAWADVQELQAALAAFKTAGKKTYVFAESYGELYPGMAEYYLASSFDQIWMQPVGTVAITGFAAEVPYFKKTLDMVGIEPDIIAKGEFKTAPEPALLEHMSDAQRQSLQDILSSMMTDFFDSVSKARGIPADRIGALVDAAPYTAQEALERKLIDHIGYADQLTDTLLPEQKDSEDKDSRNLVDAVDYLYAADGGSIDKVIKEERELTDKDTKSNAVALIYISGMIVSDNGGEGGPFGEHMAYADDIADAIQDAATDEDIKALVLRVDSPGGSPSASETIHRAVEVAKARGKYVVVSMGSEAASGGYWVSVGADRIYAQPGTLTGSIGVFGGKASFAALAGKVGVSVDSVVMGGNANLWSPMQPYTDDQRQVMGHMLDDVYGNFIARVAQGRHFAPDVVESMAQGRVWTGRQALERGLVDGMGGLRQAFEDVAKKLQVADVSNLDVIVLPDAPGPLDGVLGMLGASAGVMGPLKVLSHQLTMAAHPQWGMARAAEFEINRPFWYTGR